MNVTDIHIEWKHVPLWITSRAWEMVHGKDFQDWIGRLNTDTEVQILSVRLFQMVYEVGSSEGLAKATTLLPALLSDVVTIVLSDDTEGAA